jgi:MFS family permease
VQGLFYNLLSQNDYFKLAWIYSIAALTEFPAMTIVAKQVKRIGWEKMISLAYILTGIRLIIMPLIFIFSGDILWGYVLQSYTGVLFGLSWPTATFGLYTSLPDDQKALGQSFFGTINSVGAFLGGLTGVFISLNISDQHLTYYYLHWIAGAIAVFSGLLFLLFRKKNASRTR